MNKLLVITIATGPYKKYLYGLFKSLSKIKNIRFDLAIMQDSERLPNKLSFVEENGYRDDLYNAAKQVVNGNVYMFDIEHLPWPIVTCVKFLHIEKVITSLENRYEYVLYLDSGMRLRKPFNLSDYNVDKFNVWQHYLYDFFSEADRKGLHSSKEKCFSYLSNSERVNYVHAGCFLSRTELAISIGYLVQDLMNKELRNGIIPDWQDESCLNYIYYHNQELFNVIEHQMYDEGAPKRHPRPIEDYMLSFEDSSDCQKLKEV